MALAQPAHYTKHIPLLSYNFQRTAFHIAQRADGVHNGTALWLSGQCLAHYLAQVHQRFRSTSNLLPRAIELGSGVGLTAFVSPFSLLLDLTQLQLGARLARVGLATDVDHVVQTVLTKNIKSNLDFLPPASGQIEIRELDWSVSPEEWHWDNPLSVTSPSPGSTQGQDLQPPFQLIISADTVYKAELVTPLLRTVHALSTLSHSASHRYPLVLLCIERRDPVLVDRLFAEARDPWGFSVDRVPHAKLAKCLERGGLNWERDEWEGLEIWKLRLK